MSEFFDIVGVKKVKRVLPWLEVVVFRPDDEFAEVVNLGPGELPL